MVFVPVNAYFYLKLFYKTNRPHFLWFYRRDNPLGRTLEKLLNHEPKATKAKTRMGNGAVNRANVKFGFIFSFRCASSPFLIFRSPF